MKLILPPKRNIKYEYKIVKWTINELELIIPDLKSKWRSLQWWVSTYVSMNSNDVIFVQAMFR